MINTLTVSNAADIIVKNIIVTRGLSTEKVGGGNFIHFLHTPVVGGGGGLGLSSWCDGSS